MATVPVSILSSVLLFHFYNSYGFIAIFIFVVIGVSDGKMGKITKNFVRELKNRYQDQPVEIIEADETLSSKDAQRLMITLGVSQKERKEEDAYSAMLILQQFLDTLS
jgi:RNase H-fold protein (predicted Holliday junction resolvase)